jgi:hypothetical protein
MARDVQIGARRAMGFASYSPDDLARPASATPQGAGPAPSALLSASGGAYGDRLPSGSTDGGAETSGTAYDWDNDHAGGVSSGSGVPAVKAAAVARSAALGAAIQAFRPAWVPGPEGGIWSVLDVLPLRQFPAVRVRNWGLGREETRRGGRHDSRISKGRQHL